MICGSEALSAKDSALGILYSSAIAGAESKRVRAEQRAWVSTSQLQCQDLDCLSEAYDVRISELFLDANRKSYESFARSDGSAVLDAIVIDGMWLVFSLNATWVGGEPGEVNVGAASGAARLTGQTAHYRMDGCDLTFTKVQPTAWSVSEGEGCVWGLNVSMNGTYRLQIY